MKTVNVWKIEKHLFPALCVLGLAALIAMPLGCGGGSSGPPAGPTYTVGGNVTGLSGTIVLQNNGGDDLTVSVDSTFTFATALADGSSYNILIAQQPSGQTCTATTNSGNISAADVTDVTVTCSTTYTVGGNVTGLSGTVVLQNNGGDDLTVFVDGTFTFATALADGAAYNVLISQRPSGQTCTATTNSGNISAADVTDVTVTCSTTIPQVTSTIPADGATGVATTVLAVINFSEPMDTLSVMDNLSGVSGTSDKTWANGDATLNVDFAPAPLDTNTTYTITIFSNAKDKEGDKLASSVSFTFSTGSTLATGSISGTISDDPQSDYDNSLENTVVAVTTNDFMGTGDSTPIVIVQADSGGAFTVNNLEDGTYYIVAVQETTGNDVDPFDGDSVGVYRDILAYASSAVTVTAGGAVTGKDFSLYDPEAITGELTYAGADTGDMSGNVPDLYAYLGTSIFDGDTRLTSHLISSSDYYSYLGTTLWSYSLNPFVDSSLSTTGIPEATLVNTGLTYIPPDSYHVMAYIPTNVGSNEAVGFAPNLAVIADTGADAPGTDIVMYDVNTLYGEVSASDINTNYLYQGATVTLLGWPLMAPVSDINGSITYNAAPAGVSVAIHAEPDPADAASFYASNTAYDIWSLSDFATAGTVYIDLPSKNMVAQIASLCGLTINPAQTIGGGSIESTAGTVITGATVTISAPNTLKYLSSDMSACGGTISSTQNVQDGPQFIFQASVTSSGMATVFTTPPSGWTIDDTVIPLRAGEITEVDMEAY
ncbi:MAG TPA: hypothetical protein ENH32_02365 [Proteobacteria bacterium]|nr:hypothetical protein BMS3Abin14_02203 [bacterium BMS3Abin14]HDL52799.1 hypothetical protein [Pseudomonadota bacterium]